MLIVKIKRNNNKVPSTIAIWVLNEQGTIVCYIREGGDYGLINPN